MKKKVCLLLAGILVLACFVIPLSNTGAFDGNDYGDGGGGDFGGGGDYDNDDDDRDGGSEPSSTETAITGGIFGGIVLLVIVTQVRAKKRNSGGGGVQPSSLQGQNVILPDRTLQIENIVKAHDPNFSASDFIAFAKNVYIDIETAWANRDLSPVRPVLHDNLYFTTEKQVQAKIQQGVIYHYESMVVNTAYMTSYAKDAQFEYVTLYLNSRRIDWQEDERTGKILRGDKTTRWDMRYKMKFMRSVGAVTKQESGQMKGHNCPNCGAALEISSSGQCGYCGSVVTTGQYSWVLSDYGTVRNDTVDEGVRGA